MASATDSAHKLSAKSIWQVLKQSINEFLEDKAPRLGAALAYYTVFSIAPILVIAIGIVGWVMNKRGEDTDESPVMQQVTDMIGGEGGKAVKNMVEAALQKPHAGMVATIIGIVILLFGASGVFGQLQDALNTVWEVAPKPGRGVWGFIRDRFLSFAMVAGICFLLLVSLVISAGLSAVHHFVGGAVPGLHYLWAALNFVVSLVVITGLFALMFKVLPDVKMAWRDTLIGAAATALLFVIGKWAIGMYLGKASVASTYGAVGSLVVLLLWVYYSSQIFLLGAEFTQVYSRVLGSNYVPDEKAVKLTESQRAHEGIPHQQVLDAKAGGQRAPASDPGSAAWHPAGDDSSKPGKTLPATLGFAAGWIAARATASKPKRLMLGPGVKLVARPAAKREVGEAHLVDRFKKGWRRGVHDHD